MFFKNKDKKTKEKERGNFLLRFPGNSIYAESYRAMRANIFFSLIEKQINSLVITSSLEKEGKTNTAVNLAYTMAQTDQKVLLMDCDLRRPHLSSLFSDKKDAGITELVTDLFSTRPTRGNLKTFSVDDLFLLTKLQKRSCRLHVANKDAQVVLDFEKGVVTNIYRKNRPEAKKLANALIGKKLLSKKNAFRALERQKTTNQRLGIILHKMGFVSKKEILKILFIQTIEATRTLSLMDDGKFVFLPFSYEEDKASIPKNVGFKKLYAAFSSDKNNFKYIKESINAAIKETEIKNFFILPSGSIPSKPSELISSKQMGFLLQYLKKYFDFVIIDTPPVMLLTDAIMIAPRTDGTVFVIKSGCTERKIIQDIIAQYRASNLPIIGSVLNLVDFKKEGYYYKYYHKYYSSYYANAK